MSLDSKPPESIEPPEKLQQSQDASIAAIRRFAATHALAEALAQAAERLLLAHNLGGDLTGPYAAMESALAAWTAAQQTPGGAGE